MINNRRNFIKTTAIASVALALNSFKGNQKKKHFFYLKKEKNLLCFLLGILEFKPMKRHGKY